VLRESLNTGEQVIALNRVEEAVIVLDVVAFELGEQFGIVGILGHHFTLCDYPIPLILGDRKDW
jgi:hypothetical protein